MDLDAYRARAQAFATDLNRAHHRRFAGHDGAWDPESLYAQHAAVYDDAAIDALRAAADAGGPDAGAAGRGPDAPGPRGPGARARRDAGAGLAVAARAAGDHPRPRPRRAGRRGRGAP